MVQTPYVKPNPREGVLKHGSKDRASYQVISGPMIVEEGHGTQVPKPKRGR